MFAEAKVDLLSVWWLVEQYVEHLCPLMSRLWGLRVSVDETIQKAKQVSTLHIVIMR
jgi:hypothetical protein